MGVSSGHIGNGETLEEALEDIEDAKANLEDGVAYSGEISYIDEAGSIASHVGFVHCNEFDSDQPLSQAELAEQVQITNMQLERYADRDWLQGATIHIAEADLNDVTKQCVAENFPAASEGQKR